MNIDPKSPASDYIDAEWWFPSNDIQRTYGRLEIKKYETGQISGFELVADPRFTGYLTCPLEGPRHQPKPPFVLFGEELGTKKPLTLFGVTPGGDASQGRAIIYGQHATTLDNLRVTYFRATSPHLHTWWKQSCHRSWESLMQPDKLLTYNLINEPAIWGAPETEKYPSLSVEPRVVRHLSENPITAQVYTDCMFFGKFPASDMLAMSQCLMIFLSLCTGERFEFEPYYLGKTLEGDEFHILFSTPPSAPASSYLYAPVPASLLASDSSSYEAFREIFSKNTEIVAELHSRLRQGSVIGETDVLRQVALAEGFGRLCTGENGTPPLICSKQQLEKWENHFKTQKKQGKLANQESERQAIKGNAATIFNIQRAVENLPESLIAIVDQMMACSVKNKINWPGPLSQLVMHRDTASHFLHSLPVGHSPVDFTFFENWHFSNFLAYVLCIGALGLDAEVHARLGLLEFWRHPKRTAI